MNIRDRPVRTLRVWAGAGLVAMTVVACGDGRPKSEGPVSRIGGPYGDLLDSSEDLGPATDLKVQITAALRAASKPHRLISWARDRGLSVRWDAGDAWAVIEGPPGAVAVSFGVEIHDYRGMRGQTFYASPQQPAVPAALAEEVTELGRILSYLPARPVPTPREPER